jgi:hypothetical protein
MAELKWHLYIEKKIMPHQGQACAAIIYIHIGRYPFPHIL